MTQGGGSHEILQVGDVDIHIHIINRFPQWKRMMGHPLSGLFLRLTYKASISFRV